MLVLPFIFAGIFLLGVLNPRFTVTLLQQTLSEAGLLFIAASRRQAASSRYLLGQLPWTSTGGIKAPGAIPPTLPATSSVDSVEVPPSRGQTCLIHMASSIWAATPPTFRISTVTPVYSSMAAQILIFFLLVVFLRRIATAMVRSFRLPRSSSPTLKFHEDLRKQAHDQVFTPRTSQGACGTSDWNGNTSSHAFEIADPSVDVGLRVISGTPLAIPSPVREVGDDDNADSADIQLLKEALAEVLPPSQTTRMDMLGWAPESTHALIEEEFTDSCPLGGMPR